MWSSNVVVVVIVSSGCAVGAFGRRRRLRRPKGRRSLSLIFAAAPVDLVLDSSVLGTCAYEESYWAQLLKSSQFL